MASQTALTNVSKHWHDVLSQPGMRSAQNKYDTLKGDEHHGCGHDDHIFCDHGDALGSVIDDVNVLSAGADDYVHSGSVKSFTSLIKAAAKNKTIGPKDAQTLYFIQQFIKTQIKALQNDSLWGIDGEVYRQTPKYLKDLAKSKIFSGVQRPAWQGFKDQEKQDLINQLKRNLAEVESILPPEELQRLSKEARIAQRRLDKEWKRVDGFRNWLDGTLTKEQSAVIKALQWQTASGAFRPDKIVAGFIEHFVEGHLSTTKDRIVTGAITYVVLDAINFITSVTGAHQLFKDDAALADEIRAESSNTSFAVNTDLLIGSDPLSGGDPLSGNAPLQGFSFPSQTSEIAIEARLDQQCLDKLDGDYSIINYVVENHFSDYCHEAGEALQTLFEVKTVTPRTLQSAQEAGGNAILADGSLAAEQYTFHHDGASEMLNFAAFYDNSLHWFLLGLGAATGAKIVSELGAQGGFQKISGDFKQKGALIKERPYALGTAAGGAALYAATHQGELLNTDILPYVLLGAMTGVITQRIKIHLGNNKKAIFNLHADASIEQDSDVPLTSLDKERRYALKVAGTIAASYALLITANNTGLISHQSPEVIKQLMNGAMATAAYGGGSISWAIFDRLDDIVYHEVFYATGIAIGASATAGVKAANYGLSQVSVAPYDYKTAWKMAIDPVKQKLQPLAFATRLNLSSIKDERDLKRSDIKNMSHYESYSVSQSQPLHADVNYPALAAE